MLELPAAILVSEASAEPVARLSESGSFRSILQTRRVKR